MRRRRPVLLRTVGLLLLGGLLVLDGWLLLLNLAKHDRLPADFGLVPGLTEASPGDGRAAGESDGRALADGDPDAAAFNADATVVTGASGPGTIEVDRWPGGRGPVPEGPPVRRQVLLQDDGGLRLTGSAPDWSVVTDLVDAIGLRLGRDPSTIEVDVTWHPDASSRLADGEAVLDQVLRYQPGRIDLPEGSAAPLAAVAALLADHPELFVNVVGVVDTDASDEEAAVALGRTSVLADDLAARGIASDRVVASVTQADGDDEVAATGGLVLVRIENLLVFGPPG